MLNYFTENLDTFEIRKAWPKTGTNLNKKFLKFSGMVLFSSVMQLVFQVVFNSEDFNLDKYFGGRY